MMFITWMMTETTVRDVRCGWPCLWHYHQMVVGEQKLDLCLIGRTCSAAAAGGAFSTGAERGDDAQLAPEGSLFGDRGASHLPPAVFRAVTLRFFWKWMDGFSEWTQ